MSLDERFADRARNLIREWASSDNDSFDAMEKVWETGKTSLPLTSVTCDVILRDFEDCVNFFYRARYVSAKHPRSAAASKSASNATSSVNPTASILLNREKDPVSTAPDVGIGRKTVASPSPPPYSYERILPVFVPGEIPHTKIKHLRRSSVIAAIGSESVADTPPIIHVREGSLVLFPPMQTKAEKITEAKDHANSAYIVRLARLHALLIINGVSPTYTRMKSLRTLVRAVRLLDTRESEMIPPMLGVTIFHPCDNPNGGLFETHVLGIAAATLSALSPFLQVLPRPFVYSLHSNSTLHALGFFLPKIKAKSWDIFADEFPARTTHRWLRSIFTISFKELRQIVGEAHECANSELGRNLEDVSEQLVQLYLLHSSDLLDPQNAVNAMAGLHPENNRAFAYLFVKLMIYSRALPEDLCLAGVEKENTVASDLMSKNSIGVNDTVPSVNGTKWRASGLRSVGKKNVRSKIIMHRLPSSVREGFNDQDSFFLDFLSITDSDRLLSSLRPLLSHHLSIALRKAAHARNDSDFFSNVADARLLAKVLSLTLHLVNWSHSPLMRYRRRDDITHANNGGSGPGIAIAHNLSNKIMSYLAEGTSNRWKDTIDLGKLIKDSKSTGSHLAAAATASVAHVMLQLAASDPVAQLTDWFNEAVINLQDAAHRSSGMLAVMYDEALWSIGAPLCRSGIPIPSLCEIWHSPPAQASLPVIGNTNFVTECMPYLDAVRTMLNPGYDMSVKGTKFSCEQALRAQFGLHVAVSERNCKHEATLRQHPSGVNSRTLKISNLAISANRGDPEAAVEAFKSSTSVLLHNSPNQIVTRMAAWIRQNAGSIVDGEQEGEENPFKVAKADLPTVVSALYGDLCPGEVDAVFAPHEITGMR